VGWVKRERHGGETLCRFFLGISELGSPSSGQQDRKTKPRPPVRQCQSPWHRDRHALRDTLGVAPLPTVSLGMRLVLSSTGLLEQRTWGSASRTQILRRLGVRDASVRSEWCGHNENEQPPC